MKFFHFSLTLEVLSKVLTIVSVYVRSWSSYIWATSSIELLLWLQWAVQVDNVMSSGSWLEDEQTQVEVIISTENSDEVFMGSAASYRLQSGWLCVMYMELVHLVSKYKVCKTSRTLNEVAGEIRWMAGRLYQFPQIFPASFSCSEFGKTTPYECECVCVSGVGANGLQVEASLPKVNG